MKEEEKLFEELKSKILDSVKSAIKGMELQLRQKDDEIEKLKEQVGKCQKL